MNPTPPKWTPTPTNKRVFVKHERGCPKNDGSDRCRCTPKYRGELWNSETKRPDKQAPVVLTFGEAESWVTDRRRGVEHPAPVVKPVGQGMTADDFMAMFFAAMDSGDARGKGNRRYADKTRRDYKADWNVHWSPHVGATPIDDMDTLAWQRAFVLVAQMGAVNNKGERTKKAFSDHSLACLLTVVRAAYRWGTHPARRLVTSNPTKEMDVPAGERKKRKRVIPPELVPAYLDALTDHPTRVFWGFAIYAGLRRFEILALDWADLVQGEIFVPVSKSYNGRERRIPIVPPLAAILAAYRKALGAGAFIGPILPGPRAIRISDETIRNRTRKLWEAAGLTVHEPHEGRHTFASIAVSNRDVSLSELQEWLGHASLEETAGYVQTLPGYRRESAASRLAASFGG
jgi:integrase